MVEQYVYCTMDDKRGIRTYNYKDIKTIHLEVNKIVYSQTYV